MIDRMDGAPLLRVRDLSVSFASREGQRIPVVNRVGFSIRARQTLALVGESGCGKSVTALSILRLLPPAGRIESGVIELDGRDIVSISPRQMLTIRGREIAMIFQEPMSSLNPVFTIGDQLLETIRLHRKVDRKQAIAIAEQAMAEVGIAKPRERLNSYPHEFSGGMRQRVMIAMALACQPKILLADEPTTALDVTIQAQILELLRKLQSEREMGILLITHDLGVVAQTADIVAVMYAGRIVECAEVARIFASPLHPYTRALMRCRPSLSSSQPRLPTISKFMNDPAEFRPVADGLTPWWPRTGELGREPMVTEVQPQHWVACERSTVAAQIGE
jgi:ABC-type dipeptide/oligopeptide/nickel transport system ATPase component